MDSKVGTRYWMAPEVFAGHYTEILTDFRLEFSFTRYCSVIISLSTEKNFTARSNVFVVRAMAYHNPNITIAFSEQAQGSNTQQRITLEALQYDKDDRPSAEEIQKVFEEAKENAAFWVLEAVNTYCTIS